MEQQKITEAKEVLSKSQGRGGEGRRERGEGRDLGEEEGGREGRTEGENLRGRERKILTD